MAKPRDRRIGFPQYFRRIPAGSELSKVKLSEAEIKDLIQEEVLPFVDVVTPKGRLRVIKRDPSDDQFIECAVAGKARVIISDDKDLLSIGSYRKILIQTPAQFLDDVSLRP